MGLSDRIDPSIVAAITDAYQDASTWLPFSALEIKEVFNTPEEVAQLEKFIADMQTAADENEKTAKMIDNICDYSSTIVKILKLSRVMV